MTKAKKETQAQIEAAAAVEIAQETVATVSLADTLIAAMNACKAVSASNAKKRSDLALTLRNARVTEFLEKSNVNASSFSDLYLIEKIVKAAKALSAEIISAKDFNENTFCALKTAILCADAEKNVTRTQLHATINQDIKLDADTSALTYRARKTIDKRQQTLNVQIIEALNIARFTDSKEVMKLDADSYALSVARNVCANMTI